jgi:predicted alpha/beta superfamily hydrolase
MMESGGAAPFLNFLTSQLLPELQTRLRCNPARAGLAGHSLGSLFALYALCQKAPSFERYLLSSPSIWWDDRSIFKDYRATASTPAPTGTRAYLSIGDSDTPSMTGDIQLFETELAKQPRQNVDYRIQHFPERDHYNIVPDAFYEGLKSLYARTDGNSLA